jgi:serine/threonine-protein kinase
MSDLILRLNAALGGRYRIERELGEGGMATVYLADDLKHERKVALKVLKPELAAVVGAERFLAEIRTTAKLQHPHILTLHDSGEVEGLLYYVMPYVEGESLRARLDREHQLPVEESVRIATAVSNALDHAHRQGVIHRDIKPANILLQDGEPLVADFGIALAVSAGGGDRLTETGLSLGTPHYMSPEQATGDRRVGPATDIWALGCVLFEMLVGEPPFTASTPQAILGRIITGDAEPASSHRRTVPAHVDAAVEKALAKVPADRFRSGGELARALASPEFRLARGRAEPSRPTARVMKVGGYGLIAGAAALLTWWITVGKASPPEPTRRLAVSLPKEAPLANRWFRLLDDGSGLVYEGSGQGGSGQSLWLHRWSSFEPSAATPVPGTDGVTDFDPSPTSDEVALRVGESLRVQSLETSAARTLVSGGVFCCPRWNEDGWIYFTNSDNGLSRVPADGGALEVLTVNEGTHLAHRWAVSFAGGRYVVFEKSGILDVNSVIALLDTESSEIHDLSSGRSPSVWGTLVFFTDREATELRVAELEGTSLATPVTIVGDLAAAARLYSEDPLVYDLSAAGHLTYVVGGFRGTNNVPVWVTSDGQETPVSPRLAGPYGTVRLSPDGRRLALGATGRPQAIHVWELPDGPGGPVTRGGTVNRLLAWTRDGTGLYYLSNRLSPDPSVGAIWRTRADGVGEPEAVGIDSVGSANLAPDSAYWIYRTRNLGGTLGDIMAQSTAPGSTAFALVATDAQEAQPELSGDGRWLAYSSDTNGARQVYVRSFPDPNAAPRVQVSLETGHSPAWSPVADELFYIGEDGGMYSARYRVGTGFPVVERSRLFDASGYVAYSLSVNPRGYDVSSDGQRFLMVKRGEVGEARELELVLVLNAMEAIEQLVGR